MSDKHSYVGQLLIAMPSLIDPEFSHSVSLICEHSPERGTMSIILNHPLSMTLQELIQQSSIDTPDHFDDHSLVRAGGPVGKDHGFILHDSDSQRWPSTIPISSSLSLCASNDILFDIAHNQGPRNCIAVVGYSGWSPGQLESEIADNYWLTADVDNTFIFNTPTSDQWHHAGKLLGIDLNLLNSNVGHA